MRKGSLEGQINVILEQINSERMHAEHIRSRIQAIARDTEEKTARLPCTGRNTPELLQRRRQAGNVRRKRKPD